MWFRRHEPPVEHDLGPDMEPFRDGLAVLRRGGHPIGHVATSLGQFRTPFAPRTPKPWVWFMVVWDDGVKERSVEDYPPWTYVTDMRAGHFDWEGGYDMSRAGRYEIEWVPRERAEAERTRLGIRSEDF